MAWTRVSKDLEQRERLLAILLDSSPLTPEDRARFQEERERLFSHFFDELQALAEEVGAAARESAHNVRQSATVSAGSDRTYGVETTRTVPGTVRLVLAGKPGGLTTSQIIRAVQELRPGTPDGRVPTALKQMMNRKEAQRTGSFKNYVYRLNQVSAPDAYAKAEVNMTSTPTTNGLRMKGAVE